MPCIVFLSEKDALVPAEKVEKYFRSKGIPVSNFDERFGLDSVDRVSELSACVFRGDYHGTWTEKPGRSVPTIGEACNFLCRKVEARVFQ